MRNLNKRQLFRLSRTKILTFFTCRELTGIDISIVSSDCCAIRVWYEVLMSSISHGLDDYTEARLTPVKSSFSVLG